MAANTRRTRQKPPNVPQQVIDEAYKSLSLTLRIFHNDADEAIKRLFSLVWWTVNNVLKQDEGLKGRLADENEFLDNVKKNGEKKFTDSLRALAKTVDAQAWYNLFEDSTSFSFLDFRSSDRVLRLLVFLKDTQAPGVNPLQAADKEGMQ
jgi:hypothetical protein